MEKQCKVNSSTTKHKSFGSGLLDKRVKLGLIKVMIDKNGKMIFKPTEEGKQWMEDTYR